jgi:serine/threonine protein kinase
MVVIGDVLGGRYQIVERIETGTLAEVWSAHDAILDRKVAVKIGWRSEDGQNPFNDRELFRREAQIAAKLEHPHLLPVYDFGEHDDYLYLVARYFNETLRNRLGGQTLPSLTTLRLLQQLADAIDHLHQQGQITHGNLKPSTIVLDSQAGKLHPYISDFGIAAIGVTNVGTPIYMAPEQLKDEETTTAVDLYAFGVIILECFTGQTPFAEANINRIFYLKLQPEPQMYSARRHRPELPMGVDVVIDRLTRTNPQERYPTAQAAVDELTRAFYTGKSNIEGKVFISYARKDQDYVHGLARQLRNIGIDIWIDQDISPGANWDHHIETALALCDKMLLILSPAAVASENVHDEWSYFLEHGKAVYPFVYQPCEMSFRLRRRQFMTSTGDTLNDVAKIVDILAGGIPTSLTQEG